MRKFAIKNYPQAGIGAVVFNRKVKDNLNSYTGTNSVIVLQLLDMGYRQLYIPMKFGAREVGKSKWSFTKKIKVVIDSFVSFSYMPIRMVSLTGILIFFIGLIIALVTIINRLINPMVMVGYSTIVSVLAMGFGITNISIGIIAEYLWRTFDVSRKKPAFVVSEIIDIKS